MPDVQDFSQVALRIVEFQLAALRIGGLLCVVIAIVAAAGAGAGVLRLMTEHRQVIRKN